MEEKDSIFVPENIDRSIPMQTEISPSGKYAVSILNYRVGEGYWNYTKGIVHDIVNGGIIAIVKRNYSHFPFTFFEGHPDGHDYFLCGEDYQGQTIIQLDTKSRVDYLPPEAKDGVAFCWISITHDIEQGDPPTISVEGCVWGVPYEMVVYDFSNPMDPPYTELERNWVMDDWEDEDEEDEDEEEL